MELIADLHFHSKYSRAVSRQMIIPEIARWAKRKGIGLVTTADFTHPLWLRELKENLVEVGKGVYHYKEEPRDVLFLLTTEISSIYSQKGKGHRIHNLVFAPNFGVVEKINQQLQRYGVKLLSDGRPMTGLSSIELCELVFSVSEDCLIIPAHIFTPWYSLFGSRSGFDSIKECFGQFADQIYAVETGLSCYDEKTEVLTNNGWKKFFKVRHRDKICTLNPKTDEIEYQNPTRIFTHQYKGKMYRLKTRRVDLLVTPNHKLLYSPCDFRKAPNFSLKEARFLFNKSKRFKKDGTWIGKNEKHFTLPAVKIRHGSRYYSGFRDKKEKRFPMKSWLKFFGFWIADGWTSQGKNGDYNVCLSNQNKKLLSEMKKILKSFGYNVYHHQKGNTIRVRDYQLFYYLKQFGKASDKFISSEIKSLSKKLLEILFEYYIKGDGHVYGRTKKGLSATTISTRLRDDLQEIALKLGMSAYYKLGRKKGTPFHGGSYKNRIYKQKEDSWVVYFIRKNVHAVLPSTIKKHGYIESWVDYGGLVYCVAVPNHVIYIRRSGIPVWCGNSDPAMNWRIEELDSRSILSFSDAHSPAKLGREVTVFEIKGRESKRAGEKERFNYRDIKKAIQEQKIAYTIEFYPEEGKYHYTGHRNCEVKQSPEETKKLGTTCPVCGKPLTVGVIHRVEELAKRPAGYQPKNRPQYKMLVPLMEILSEALSAGVSTQTVRIEYNRLVERFDSEFNILLKVDPLEIAKIAGEKVGQGIKKVREGKIVVDPGYDGVFGTVKIWGEVEKEEKKQMSLF